MNTRKITRFAFGLFLILLPTHIFTQNLKLNEKYYHAQSQVMGKWISHTFPDLLKVTELEVNKSNVKLFLKVESNMANWVRIDSSFEQKYHISLSMVRKKLGGDFAKIV